MAWWGWLIVCAVCAAAAGFVVWWSMRRSVHAATALAEVERLRSEASRKAAYIAAEAKHKAEEEWRQLAVKMKAISVWYEAASEDLRRERQDEFQRLRSDPIALDHKLDQLLSRRGDDDTVSDDSTARRWFKAGEAEEG